MRLMFSLLSLMILVFGMHAGACKVSEVSAQSSVQADTPDAKPAMSTSAGKSQVMSVLLNAALAKNKEIQFSIKDVIKADGYFKNTTARDGNPTGKFKARFTDTNGAGLDSAYFANPLKKEIEYTGDNGKLTRKTVNTEKETVFLRVNNNANAALLEIYDGSNKKIGTLNLKNPKK